MKNNLKTDCFRFLAIIIAVFSFSISKAQDITPLPFFEGFEQPWINKDGMDVPSVFWKILPTGTATWSRFDAGVNGSSHCAIFTGPYNTSSSRSFDLYVDFSSISGDKILTFYYYNQIPSPPTHFGLPELTAGKLYGFLSLDGGATFTKSLFILEGNTGWSKVSIDLGELNTSGGVIRFQGQTGRVISGDNLPDSYTSSIRIDNVSIYTKIQSIYTYADVPYSENFLGAWSIADSANAAPSLSWRNLPGDVRGSNVWYHGQNSANFSFFQGQSFYDESSTLDLFVDFSKVRGKKFLSFRDSIDISSKLYHFTYLYGGGSLSVSLSTDSGKFFREIYYTHDCSNMGVPVFIDLKDIYTPGIIRFKGTAGSIHGFCNIFLKDILISNVKADFAADTLAGPVPLTVSFMNQSFGDSVTCKWDFNNDGVIDANGQTPSYKYDTAGLYSVKLFAFKDVVSDSVLKNDFIRVYEQPVPSSLPFYENFDSAWIDRGAIRDIPSNSWRNIPATGDNSWSREDDGVLRGAWEIRHFYNGPGINLTHYACFQSSTTNLSGSLDLFLNFSSVSGNKGLSFWYKNFLESEKVEKDSLKVYLSTDGGITFERLVSLGTNSGWEKIALNLGNVNIPNGVIRFEALGYDEGASDIQIDDVKVDTFMADFLADETSGALPLTVHFTNKSIGNISSYKWDFNNDNIVDATTSDPNYTFNTIGTYSVKLTIEGSSVSDSIIRASYVVVTAYASVPFYENFEEKWINRDYIQDVPSIFWKSYHNKFDKFWSRDDDSQIQQVDWQKYSPPGANGTYHSARSFSSRGGFNHILDLFVNFSSTVGKKCLSFWYINTNGQDSLKLYLSTDGGKTFDTSFFALGVKSIWTKVNVGLGNISSSFGVIRFVNTPGWDFENEEDTSDIGLDEIRIGNLTSDFYADVTVGTEPLAVYFTDQSIGNPTSWEWDFNNDDIIDAVTQNASFTFNKKGDYTVKLKVSTLDFQDINEKISYIKVSDLLNVDSKEYDNSIKIFPIPAHNCVKIEFLNSKYVNSSFEIFDSTGKLIISSIIERPDYVLDMSGFRDGIYYFQIINSSEKVVKKIIKN